ncbi:hypothetical protein VTI74DRAFT_327 [Chaetomium olivicolor]
MDPTEEEEEQGDPQDAYVQEGEGEGMNMGGGGGSGGDGAAKPRDKGPQKLGCPMCQRGLLVSKCRDTFHYRERVLECSAQGCWYRLELERGSFRDADQEVEEKQEDSGKGKKRGTSGKGSKKTAAKQNKQEEPEDDDDEDSFNPLAAATFYKPAKPRKQILVDLTGEDEPLDVDFLRFPTKPAAAQAQAEGPLMEVGAEIIVLSDDNEPTVGEKKQGAKEDFDDFSSGDTDELIRLAEEVDDDLDVDDERELAELADHVSASMTRE